MEEEADEGRLIRRSVVREGLVNDGRWAGRSPRRVCQSECKASHGRQKLALALDVWLQNLFHAASKLVYRLLA